MTVGFNLKYGDGYEDLPGWDQFVSILNSARGRKKARFCTISCLIENGADHLEVQKAAGHARLSTTDHYYRTINRPVFNDNIFEKSCGFGENILKKDLQTLGNTGM